MRALDAVPAARGYDVEDGVAARVATELARRGIPFIVYSGLPPGSVSLPELARATWHEATWHEKPGSGDELFSSLAELMDDGPFNWVKA